MFSPSMRNRSSTGSLRAALSRLTICAKDSSPALSAACRPTSSSSSARKRQDALHHVGVQELRAELDELVGRQAAQPGAQLLGHLRGGVEVRPGLRVLAHGENPAGNRQPIATAPRKSAPSSAASVKSTPTSVAPANDAPWRFAARSDTSTSRAPEKSAFSREAPPRRESRNTTRTRRAWSNRARYSL